MYKLQITNSKLQTNSNSQYKIFDLEDRTKKFAVDCRDFVHEIPKTISNIEYIKQLIRSSGSQAANYIEANESLSKKDFVMRIKICRKEAKEDQAAFGADRDRIQRERCTDDRGGPQAVVGELQPSVPRRLGGGQSQLR